MSKSPIKRRWTIAPVPAPHGCVGVVTEQPVRSASPSTFVDLREQTNHSPLNVALGNMMLAVLAAHRPTTPDSWR